MMPIAPLILHAALLARLGGGYPFAVGETLRYDAKLGYFPVGEASMSVTRMARERGTDSFVFTAGGQGGPPGWRVKYDMTSWVGSARFNSLRFHRRLEQGGKVEEHGYVIVPDSARYREEGVEGDWAAPANPLDELAFLYYLRAAPLTVGRTYSLARYFKTGYNPIQVKVSGRESIPMPDGAATSCLLLQVSTRGTTMRVWLTDDNRRLPAQLEIPLPFGTVTFSLVSSTSPDSSRSPSG
jgi:hypothetical protein